MVLSLAFARSFWGRLVGVLPFVCLLVVVTAQGQEVVSHALLIKVHDESNQPVAKAQVTLHVNGTTVWSGTTNERGETSVAAREFPSFELSVSKKGYEPVNRRKIALEGPSAEVEVTLLNKLQTHETVTVKADESTSSSSVQELERAEMKQLPNRPANVASALVFTPGVVK